MIQLPELKTRVARLEDLTAKLGKEVARCKAGEGVLSAAERRQHLDRISSPRTTAAD